MDRAHIVFSGSRASRFVPAYCRFIAVRFKAGALKNFTDIPFTELLDTYPSTEAIWGPSGKDLATRVINGAEQTAVLGKLSEKMNITNRHFRRRFLAETALSPKHFQQLARFHATIKPLLINKERNYLSTALGNGYFDQSHFIKDFNSFMSCTPSQFLQDKNFMSHFYYPSLDARGTFAENR